MNRSPLRYPGGKSSITPLIKLILSKKDNRTTTYIEPFAGGAGVAINLLLDGVVDNIVINDYDKAIYSFWRALKEQTDDLISLIEDTPVNIEEWYKQKAIYSTSNRKYSLELGFATFFLNRTNRSGILNAGPIGGYSQSDFYKIDARYNKPMLVERIQSIATKKKSIFIYNKEVRSFLTQILPKFQENAFIYFDPPYFVNGKRLYKNFFVENDHVDIARSIEQNVTCDWVMTYDDETRIRSIYSNYVMRNYVLNYSAANKGKGTELIIFKSSKLVPNELEIRNDLPRLAISNF
ncbi:Adenine modification methylase, M.EcoRV-type [Syntrophomonas zehnderi OL-4]|uniref:site-specific DNA-methyltransferase (adenine-specific) n=1 Tax=Syntrophomonas zehnderi OL-4 TaxID=690567 RepID=A0A0E4C7X9_9FIRM|nr:DNA adenine methylase [Syntrophomonas zehnderi]CFX15431.1 Adenine modification methylase, M.EcoRV-type [Syntrophomonas zehnderi OL-4]